MSNAINFHAWIAANPDKRDIINKLAEVDANTFVGAHVGWIENDELTRALTDAERGQFWDGVAKTKTVTRSAGEEHATGEQTATLIKALNHDESVFQRIGKKIGAVEPCEIPSGLEQRIDDVAAWMRKTGHKTILLATHQADLGYTQQGKQVDDVRILLNSKGDLLVHRLHHETMIHNEKRGVASGWSSADRATFSKRRPPGAKPLFGIDAPVVSQDLGSSGGVKQRTAFTTYWFPSTNDSKYLAGFSPQMLESAIGAAATLAQAGGLESRVIYTDASRYERLY